MRNDKDRAHMEITPTTLLPGSPVVCLVCDRTIRDPHGRDIHNLFLESSVTSHSHQPLATILADVLRAPLNANEVYSKTLCVRCMKLVDELDDLQCRADAIKTSLFSRYNRSFIKRLKLPGPDAALGGGIGLENEDEEVEIEVDDRLVARLCVKKEEEPECDDDDDDDDTLRPEDQGILPDDPEFNPARDDSAWLGVRARTRGRPRGRGRGRGRGRPRGRGRGRGRGPGRPPKIPRDSERATTSSESLGEKLGALVTKILGEDEDEHTGEEKKVKLGSAEGEGESKGDEESLDATATSPKSLEVTRPRQPGKRVPVLSEKMRLSLADLSKRSRTLPASDAAGGGKEPKKQLIRVQEVEKRSGTTRVKRQYRKRPYIIHLCKFCMKVCPTGEQLKEHQRTHDNIECQFCGKVLARIGAWESHLKIFHNVEIQVPGSEDALTRPKDDVDCDVCGKQFASKSALAYHLKLHDNKIYPCDKCSKVFKHPSNLKTHQLRHESKNYVCVKCSKKFHTNFALLMHDNQSHRMARSWKCKYCSKAFTRCAAFKEHLRIHTGEKPYECQMCGVKFRKIHHLKSHTKQHELKPTRNGVFKCQDCPNAVFLHKVSYDRHRKLKHPKVEVNLLTNDSGGIFSSELALKRDYVIAAEGGSDNQADASYIDFVDVENIEMVGLDDSSSVGLGGQGGQCIIVLSEATEDEEKIQSCAMPEKEGTSNDITEEGNIELEFFKEEDSEGDKLTSQVPVLAEAQLASLQEHMQLSEEAAADDDEQLQQQLSVATLEGGKFHVQMDGETFEVYTVGTG